MTNPSTPEPKERQDRIARGLSAVEYAHGRYDRLRDAMFDVIARDTRYLREFNSRDPADPAIALIDSWAVAGDVLSFYAERIANESWLPTAFSRMASMMASGVIESVQPLESPSQALTAATTAAVWQWEFTPARLNGRPIAVDMFVTVTFTEQP